MIKRRLSIFAVVLAVTGAGVLLFQTSQGVQQKEAELVSLQQAVEKERKEIRVLRAEWDYLNRPDRLEALAAGYLGMQGMDAAQIEGGADEAAAPAPASVSAFVPAPVLAPAPASALRVPPLPGVKPRAAAPSAGGYDSSRFDALLRDLGGGGKGAP